MSSHRILVSGGRGFIGRRLVMALRADGFVPRVLTRDQPEADEVQGDLTDLTDRAALDRACSGIETVFHCAGHAHAFGALGAEEEALHWRVNFEGSQAYTTLQARDGSEHQIADSAAPIPDSQGRIVGVVLVFSDVSEQYRLQRVLLESERRTARWSSPRRSASSCTRTA